MASRTARTQARSRRGTDPVSLEGGLFRMGSDNHYVEEGPSHLVRVSPFAIDPYPVTNRQFAAFVKQTRYRTVAERPLDAAAYPGVSVEAALPGSLVFRRTRGPVDLRDFRQWWMWVPGACWRYPEGPGSSLAGLEDHPVVHIAFEDAQAYAAWIGKALPTEAEWECAARGGRDNAEYAWGTEFAPDDCVMAHTWWGEFPWKRVRTHGFQRTAPVGTYPANGYGLFDMIGNVWEWTTDWYAPQHEADAGKPCCAPQDPRGGQFAASFDLAQPGIRIPRRVVKGGSFLCSPSYCRRYRPAARHAQMVDTGTSHVGFRCLARLSEQGTQG
jgi:sulfatase modifying factor 1